MRVLLLDFRVERRKKIDEFLRKSEHEVDLLERLSPSLDFIQLAKYDFYILHGSKDQGDIKLAIEPFSGKPALIYTAGVLQIEASNKCSDPDSMWCHWEGDFEEEIFHDYNTFRNSTEGQFLLQYLSELTESGALEAKRKMSVFDVILEEQLLDLYQMLENFKPLEDIIKKRDEYFFA